MTTSDSAVQRVDGQPGIPDVDFLAGGALPVMSNARRMDELSKLGPILHSTAAQGFWVLTNAELIQEALGNPAVFSSSSTLVTEPNPPYLWIPQMLDPPEHTKWRRYLAPYFAPGNMKRLEASVRERCVTLIDGIADSGACDFRRDFADRFPTSIFMDMFGLPIEELDQFLAWEGEILHLAPEDDPDMMRAITAMMSVMGYFDAAINDRRKNPRDDMISHCLSWEDDGEPLPHEQLLSFCLLMFMAGMDTVSIALNYSFWHLANNADDRRRIVNEPEIIPSAVEELLRVFSFVPPSRKVIADIDFHGVNMKAGDMVFIGVSAASRDPQVFDEPTKVDFDRHPNRHFAFGSGPHRCIGAALARRELQVGLEEWHKRIPEYRIPDGFDVVEQGAMHGIKALSLEWDV